MLSLKITTFPNAVLYSWHVSVHFALKDYFYCRSFPPPLIFMSVCVIPMYTCTPVDSSLYLIVATCQFNALLALNGVSVTVEQFLGVENNMYTLKGIEGRELLVLLACLCRGFLPKSECPRGHEALDHIVSDEGPPLLVFGNNVLENSYQLLL